MKFVEYEYDTGHRYGPASAESLLQYRAALAKGRPFFLYPYFGYYLRMVVKEEPDAADVCDMQKEKAGGASPPTSST